MLEEIRGLKIETIALRHHRRGYELSRDYDRDETSTLKDRVGRIERRFVQVDEK